MMGLDIYDRLTQKNPGRYEPDYAMVLNNYAVHLSNAGQYEEAMKHTQQAIDIRRRLGQKNPERYEQSYTTSLISYSKRLCETGQYDDALKHAEEALEIRRRLKEKNPDRYEPVYALSLTNCANYLSDIGQYENAMTYAQEALAIYCRLAVKLPLLFDEATFNNTCLIYFLQWLSDYSDVVDDLTNLDNIPKTIREHRRSLFLFYAYFVKACRTSEQTTQNENFKQALLFWKDLTLVCKNEVLEYWLSAAVYCRKNIPDLVNELDWQTSWQKFINQHHGKLPQWMQEAAHRLKFEWPTINMGDGAI